MNKKKEWPFRYFSKEEIVNPRFDDNPASHWDEMPPNIQSRLKHTLRILDDIRFYYGLPLVVNSTWRPKSNGSPHELGFAIDFQPAELNKIWGYKLFNWLRYQDKHQAFRVIWEWKNKDTFGWIHLDSGFKDYGKKVMWVSYPNEFGMEYVPFANKAPWEYLGVML